MTTAIFSTIILTILAVVASILFSKYIVKRLKNDEDEFKRELFEKTSPDPLIRENYTLKRRIKNYQVILLFCMVALVNLRHDLQNINVYIAVALGTTLFFEPILSKLFTPVKK